MVLRQRDKDGRFLRGTARFFCGAMLALLLAGEACAEVMTPARLAEAGAPQLALQILNDSKPDPVSDLGAWMRWNKERIAILASSRQWPVLALVDTELPAELPADYLAWLASVKSQALLAMGQAAAARETLLDAVWTSPVAADNLPEWRHLIIQTYLEEGRGEDAFTAMIRHRQDYGESSRAAQILRARVLLSNGRPEDARYQLRQLKDDPEAAAMVLICRLREGEPPAQINQSATQQLMRRDIEPAVRQLLVAVQAESVQWQDDTSGQIAALEKLLATLREQPLPPGLFKLGADDLWQAYLGRARSIGNQAQLLLGNDVAWFELAAAKLKKAPQDARALYALLGRQAQSAAVRDQAHTLLVDNLLTIEGGSEIIYQLYLNSDDFTSAEALPSRARYVLAEQAISEGDLELASRMLAKLPEAPGKADAFNWQLRRTKVFILAGDHAAAIALLEGLMQDAQVLDKNQIDRLIQLLFDLQKVGENESAYNLLNKLYLRLSDSQTRRELLYWMADSRMAEKNYREAARLYLHSAAFLGPKVMDPWAQTARYQAADALAKAGLTEDARYLYKQLLDATKDPARRSVLSRDLEQLRLEKQAKHAGN